jgi:hypothetical protein
MGTAFKDSNVCGKRSNLVLIGKKLLEHVVLKARTKHVYKHESNFDILIETGFIE